MNTCLWNAQGEIICKDNKQNMKAQEHIEYF